DPYPHRLHSLSISLHVRLQRFIYFSYRLYRQHLYSSPLLAHIQAEQPYVRSHVYHHPSLRHPHSIPELPPPLVHLFVPILTLIPIPILPPLPVLPLVPPLLPFPLLPHVPPHPHLSSLPLLRPPRRLPHFRVPPQHSLHFSHLYPVPSHLYLLVSP